MPIEIKKCSFSELSENNNFAPLVKEAAASPEVYVEGIPVEVKFDAYKFMDASGTLSVLGCFLDSKLIGFSFILFPVLPHHAAKIAVIDTIYVEKEYRDTGAGLKLIRETESFATRASVKFILCTTAADSDLSRLLEHKDFKDIRRIYFKKLNDE